MLALQPARFQVGLYTCMTLLQPESRGAYLSLHTYSLMIGVWHACHEFIHLFSVSVKLETLPSFARMSSI